MCHIVTIKKVLFNGGLNLLLARFKKFRILGLAKVDLWMRIVYRDL